jgi:type I restriction enzyme S subunit
MKRVLLGEISKISSGGTPSRANPAFWDGTIPWVKTGEVQFNRICDTEEKITIEAVKGSATKIYKPNTLLMAMYGQGKTRGQVAILGKEAAINQACAAIEPEVPGDERYLFQYLSFNYQNIRRLSNTGSQENLSADIIRAIPVVYPAKDIRTKIADILSTWDEALETLDILIAAKNRQKQALMQQLLTGKTRVKGAKGKWKKVRMGDVLERVFRPIDWHADLPLNLVSLRRRCGGLFRRPDVKGSEYKTQDLHEIRAGDFLISKRQVVHGAWGYVTQEFAGGHVSKEYAILDNQAPDKLHMPFFAWLAQTRRLIRLARVSSTGVHIEKLIFDPGVFLRESIRIPADIAEQQHIGGILDTADQELTLLRTQRQTLDQQKRGLMQRLLTGKTRVKIP